MSGRVSGHIRRTIGHDLKFVTVKLTEFLIDQPGFQKLKMTLHMP